MRKPITIRELADDSTTVSSTRWAFATVVKVDVAITVITFVAGLVGHFIGKPLESSFYGNIAMLLGIITGIVTTSKALQGFEPGTKSDKEAVEESRRRSKVDLPDEIDER